MRCVRHLLESKAPEVFAIGPDAPVIDAIRLMAEKRIGAVVVMQDGRLAGILSERDYARKIVLQGRSSATTPVRDIMTADVVTVGAGRGVDRRLGEGGDRGSAIAARSTAALHSQLTAPACSIRSWADTFRSVC